LPVLLGPDAAGLSPANIARLTTSWEAEYRNFRRRSLKDRDYVYVWADGIHVNIRLEEDRLCLLVLIGVRPDGTKELIAVEDGYRESTESWLSLLRELKARGMTHLRQCSERSTPNNRLARAHSGLGTRTAGMSGGSPDQSPCWTVGGRATPTA
jgi:hypothetical protein